MSIKVPDETGLWPIIDGTHIYLSTPCLHALADTRPELHHECTIDTRRYDGSHKVGATCKWCPAQCICECHQKEREASDDQPNT